MGYTECTEHTYVHQENGANGPSTRESTQWDLGLEWLGILDITYMPHFGRSVEVNTCVKQLLSFYRGYIWLDTKVPFMADLIFQITSLPKEGVDPSPYFRGKDNEKRLVARLKKKYDVVCDKRAYIIRTINDKAT